MKKNYLLLMIILFLCLGKATLHAEKIKLCVLDEVEKAVRVPENLNKLLMEQLVEKLLDSGKFVVVTREDKNLKRLFEEQKFSSERMGRVDITDSQKAQYGLLAGAEYILVVSINNFSTNVIHSRSQRLKTFDRSLINIAASLTLLHSTTGNIKAKKNLSEKQYRAVPSRVNYALDTELLNNVISSLCTQIVKRVIDDLFPIKVLKRFGNSVFINRGDGQGIQVGNVFQIYALDKAVDADTEEALDIGFPVGKIEIINVLEKTAEGRIVEDFGVNTGCLVKEVEKSRVPAEENENDTDTLDW